MSGAASRADFEARLRQIGVERQRPFRRQQHPGVAHLVEMRAHAAQQRGPRRVGQDRLGGHFSPSPGRQAPGGMRPGST